MPINFIVNDPMAGIPGGAAAITISPSRNRPANRSGWTVHNLPAQAQYAISSSQFVAWQAREAALRAVVAVEAATGPLPGWRGNPSNRRLALIPFAGQELNAYYDRASISFFVTRVGGTDVHTGASTDVVAHEAGHAILDALRPDLWGVNMMEAGAFHEGFGDIVAIHTALSDAPTRQILLGIGLRQPNFVEATAEELSDAIRRVYGAQHPAAGARRALNTHLWSFPSSLPANGPPHVLINEEHSLGQLASGVYYDLVCALFARSNAQDEAALWAAAIRALDLVVRGVRAASIRPRFFEAWGRAMLVADAQQFGGAHGADIVAAFGNHGIMIGTQPGFVPRMRLTKPNVRRSRGKQLMTAGAKSMLRKAMGVAPSERLTERHVALGEDTLIEMSATRVVDLTGLSERLQGVQSTVPQPALVASVDEAPALLGALESEFALSHEVRAYVASLLAHNSIAFAGDRTPRKKSAMRANAGVVAGTGVTHAVVSRGGGLVLERKAFACGCRAHRR